MPLRRVLLALVGLLLFGVARLPFERQLTADLRGAHFLESHLSHDLREQTTQMEFVAALSGFRSVVGDLMWIRAVTAWQNTEWGTLKLRLDAATTLQPRNELFWENSSWHMAWNASVAMMQDAKQPRETLRLKAAREYIRLGEGFCCGACSLTPTRAGSGKVSATFTRKKWTTHAGPRTLTWRRPAARMPGPTSTGRACMKWRNAPAAPPEAYHLLREAYNDPRQRLPTLLKTLDRLQKELKVPEAEWVDIRKDLEEATPGRRPPLPGN